MKKINNAEGGRPLKTSDLALSDTYDEIITNLATGLRAQLGDVDNGNEVLILEGCEITESSAGYNISAGHVSAKGVKGAIYVPAQQGVALPWKFATTTQEADDRTFYNGELKAAISQLAAISDASGAMWLSIDTPRAEEARTGGCAELPTNQYGITGLWIGIVVGGVITSDLTNVIASLINDRAKRLRISYNAALYPSAGPTFDKITEDIYTASRCSTYIEVEVGDIAYETVHFPVSLSVDVPTGEDESTIRIRVNLRNGAREIQVGALTSSTYRSGYLLITKIEAIY